ncbi:bifunctional serine/threonine-protein kinase/ABC transporter substrate-binding protein [Streptomyces sp. WAC06614]|uniref:bifunctional serine/threonine-protein kinase/ABC transporter substrate-binding protein n=1 Tax=Streptomyces sp. WAC06614 TaxID=2487416 RepID=UPI000F76BBB3|nr:bifunctional serine/threonine-protein kinase/ABC transporter substrate-binding protein [Streptomyces sp. WAC06614]RSS78918.1 serine/threonine protein kinase [Streptomyces sp. WAC06614]
MRPLLPADPSVVGGHRLLGRLGSGGMGTVYLGRSPAGALVAVKVIRADHAADPAFRARFRREAEAAGGLSGRWVVPVVAADPEAPEPWLATPFVPGPALSEAVGGYGPLPVAAVRTLGVRLAQALAEVHAAGLVHRDVKPGNVLLAPDGPRLIDFGIARAAGAPTLTAVDAVVGTPGYLPPEQARPGGPVPGPAGDVFSLGCVLAYAATGRGPFGGGHPAAVVFRTVHDEPVLDALPAELLGAVSACLVKDPAGRPTPEALGALLGPAQGADWLPGPLARLIAERSTRALELPVAEPTRVDTAAPAPRGLPRRRLLTGGAALLAVGAPGAWFALRGTGGGAGPPAERGPLPTLTFALQADLSGPGRAVGQAHERGMRLAMDAHNAREDVPFRLALRVADDGGDSARAEQTAGQLAAEPGLFALVGPTLETAVTAVAARCTAADLTQVLVSVPTPDWLSDWRTLCGTAPSASQLVLPMLHYLTRVRPARRTGVVEDGPDAGSAWQVTRALEQSPPAQGTVTVHRMPAGGSDFAAAARALVGAQAEAVVFAGTSPERAGRFARALAEAGFQGPRMGVQQAMEPAFLTAAGPASEGWLFSSFYGDPLAVPAAAGFVSAHRAAYGEPPARWAAEAYDAVGLLATALAGLDQESRERGGLSRRVFRTTYQGLAKPLAFDATTRVLTGNRTAHLFRAGSGAFHYLGLYPDVTSA